MGQARGFQSHPDIFPKRGHSAPRSLVDVSWGLGKAFFCGWPWTDSLAVAAVTSHRPEARRLKGTAPERASRQEAGQVTRLNLGSSDALAGSQ